MSSVIVIAMALPMILPMNYIALFILRGVLYFDKPLRNDSTLPSVSYTVFIPALTQP